MPSQGEALDGADSHTDNNISILTFLGNPIVNMLEWNEGNSDLMKQVIIAKKEFESIKALNKLEQIKEYEVKI